MTAALSPEAAAAKLCKAMRFKIAPTTTRKNQRLVDAAHEGGGHAFISVFDGVLFETASIAPHPSVPKWLLGQLVFHQDRTIRRVTGPNLLARVSCDMAGLVAEELVTGAVQAHFAVEDCYKACARLGFDPATATNEDLGRLWDVVHRVRAVLGARADAVNALAKALVDRGQMTRAECVTVARGAGVMVGAPTFLLPVVRPEWVGLVREDARVNAARAQLRALAQERADASYGRSLEAR